MAISDWVALEARRDGIAFHLISVINPTVSVRVRISTIIKKSEYII
jgi:hypothetical protein